MELGIIINKCADHYKSAVKFAREEKDYMIAAGLSSAFLIADNAMTAMCVKSSGAAHIETLFESETNPITVMLVNYAGLDAGLTTHTLASIGMMLPLCYILNKVIKKMINLTQAQCSCTA